MIGRLILAIGALLTGMWLVGFICADRWYWSQWLLWMTGLSLIPAGGFLLWGHWVLQRRLRGYPMLLMLLGVGVWVSGLLGFQLRRSDGQVASIRILQWAAGPVIGTPEPYASFIVDTDADISIVHGGHRAATTEAYRSWAADRQVAIRGAFLIASRIPIHQLQTLIWANDITLVLLELHPPEAAPIRMILTDLPSDPLRSRAAIATRVQEALAAHGDTVNIMLGDFNMTQDSWQLRHLAADLQPMWSHCGAGWGGTFPRRWPVVQLDHVLSSPERVISMHTITPPVGRHRAMVTQYVLQSADEH